MTTAIFHSVNAGLYVWDGKTGVLVDGLHHGAREGFSETPAALRRQLAAGTGLFAHLDGLVFTHLHPDHFDGEALLQAQEVVPLARLYGPELPETTVAPDPVGPGAWRFCVGEMQVVTLETVHDGAPFRNTPHRSLLLQAGGESLFVAGDALLDPSLAQRFAGVLPPSVTAAFVNVYQASSPQGLAFLRALRPRRIFLYHLPLEEDDTFRYRALARSTQNRFPADLPGLELLRPMEWIDGRQPDWWAGDQGMQ